MQADTQAHVAFHLTGRRTAEALQSVDGLGLKPALFAGYEDLTSLRYDFPVVLAAEGAVESVSGLFDRALAKSGTVADPERLRKHALRLEREIRVLLAGGAAGTLGELLDQAATRVASQTGPAVDESRKVLRKGFGCDGELADCDGALPRRLVMHQWHQAQAQKTAAFGDRVRRLVLRLSGILQADAERTRRGVTAERLEATVGPGFAEAFDFAAMSRMLARSRPREGMPAARRRRIDELLQVLKAQRFVPAASRDVQPYGYGFDSSVAALRAWRDRQPKRLELARALVMGGLEAAGEYEPARHDAVFEAWDAASVGGDELSALPDMLVCIDDARLDARESEALMEILSSGLPIKVLLQADDLADEHAPGMRGRRLASLAMGLNSAYVLQASASSLYRLRDRVARAMEFRGPALLSVYSGAHANAAGLPPYLMAAAAMESRAFPAFSYDPSAGANWAARFNVQSNPQVELDWPMQGFSWEDGKHQAVSQDLAFTVVDFLAADARFAQHLARVPHDKWNGSLVPVDESLARSPRGVPDKVPSIWMVDVQHRLQKVIVDQALMRQAGRCRELWHSLQELGGIHNSHAEALLARERAAWEERARQQQLPPLGARDEGTSAPAAAVVPAAAPVAAAPAAEAAPPARDPDEPYIETARCSSCNECTQINNRMFAYDANQQAYIADLGAGTYAQLVEAAENCQVAVIHPGKPRNPDEPGIAELLKRAEAFA